MDVIEGRLIAFEAVAARVSQGVGQAALARNGGRGNGSDGSVGGLERRLRVCHAPAGWVEARASHRMPDWRQNSGCSRFHRSCYRLVTVTRWSRFLPPDP